MRQSSVTVEKIGGTSMSRFGEVIENIVIRNPERIYGRIYVVSAYGGVTNELLEHKKTGRPGIYKRFEDHKDFSKALGSLKKNLCNINKTFKDAGLDLKAAEAFICERIDSAQVYLNSMFEVLSSGYVKRREILLAARELLASLGETHSAFNSANMLKNRGYKAEAVDLSGWHDSRELTIDERIKQTFKALTPQKTLLFATGYCKGTEGIMREFDRGYSEVTFSKIAVIIKAAEAVIHKEYHLSSGDPVIIGEDKVKPVCNTNFDVADQLADVGMEAIHPKASKPLELSGIPIRVTNAFDPDHPGTLIKKDFLNSDARPEIVTGSVKVSCIEIHDARMVGEVGFDLGIMQVFARHGVSYICKSTNANTISMVVSENGEVGALLKELKSNYELVTNKAVAIVSAIGTNIARPGIMAKAAAALADAGINILAVSQTTRQTNIQFIIERDDFENAQQVLHQALCE